MSRVAKRPVDLGKDLSVELQGRALTIKGKKGSLSLQLNSEVEVKVEGNSRAGYGALGRAVRRRDGRHHARADREHGYGHYERLPEEAGARRRRLSRRRARARS